MVGLDDIAAAFGFDAKADADWTTLGKVTAVNQDGTLSVLLGGSATPTTCAAYCVASAGDIVFVAVSKGKARAIARQGGDAGSVIWGGIGGTLSNQTDLQNALNAKADASALPKFEEITGTNIGTAQSSGGVSHSLNKPITDYDLLVISMQFGSSNALTNARLTYVIPVSQVNQWSSTTDVQNGVKCSEFIYCYPASSPSWYVNVCVGFTAASTLYAYRRTYGNLAYWTVSKIYGIKF